MKLIYLANIRLPTEKAHGIQIMKTCEALAAAGVEVELVVPRRATPITRPPFEYYGVKENFTITKLWCLDTVRFGWLGFWIESLTFAKRAAWYVVGKKGIFYTRDESIAFYLHLLGKKVVWEAHMGQRNFFVRSLIRRRVPIVVISEGLKRLYMELGVRAGNLMVAHDGVDMARFDVQESKTEARQKLGLVSDIKIAMYTGSKYAWKGTETLERAGKLLPGVRVMVVSDKPHTEIPLYLRAADVLVLPNSARENISSTYTSPMKLFEYMASGVPIVASDVPAIREILAEDTAYFARPDDPRSFADMIAYALTDIGAPAKAARAQEEVKKYTWDTRAHGILSFASVVLPV